MLEALLKLIKAGAELGNAQPRLVLFFSNKFAASSTYRQSIIFSKCSGKQISTSDLSVEVISGGGESNNDLYSSIVQ